MVSEFTGNNKTSEGTSMRNRLIFQGSAPQFIRLHSPRKDRVSKEKPNTTKADGRN